MRKIVERNEEELCGWWRNCLKARSCKVIAVWEREGACGGEGVCVYCVFREVASVRQEKGGGEGIHIKLDNRNGMSGWSGGVEDSRWRAISHTLPFTSLTTACLVARSTQTSDASELPNDRRTHQAASLYQARALSYALSFPFQYVLEHRLDAHRRSSFFFFCLPLASSPAESGRFVERNEEELRGGGKWWVSGCAR